MSEDCMLHITKNSSSWTVLTTHARNIKKTYWGYSETRPRMPQNCLVSWSFLQTIYYWDLTQSIPCALQHGFCIMYLAPTLPMYRKMCHFWVALRGSCYGCRLQQQKIASVRYKNDQVWSKLIVLDCSLYQKPSGSFVH